MSLRSIAISGLGLLVAGGVGLALATVGGRAGPPRAGPRAGLLPKDALSVAAARGRVWASSGAGRRLGLVAGDEAPLVGAYGVGEGRARALLDLGQRRLLLFDGGTVVLGERRAPVALERGGALAFDSAGVRLAASHRGVSIEGRMVGLFADEDGVSAVVLDAQASIVKPGAEPKPIAGPAVIDPKTLRAQALPDRLEVEVIEVLRWGRSTRISGRTAPGARVRVGKGADRVEGRADARGRFVLRARGVDAKPAVEATDALGRWASPGAPSASLAELVRELGGGHIELPQLPEKAALDSGPEPNPRRRGRSRPASVLPAPAPSRSGLGRRDGTPESLPIEVEARRRLPSAPSLSELGEKR